MIKVTSKTITQLLCLNLPCLSIPQPQLLCLNVPLLSIPLLNLPCLSVPLLSIPGTLPFPLLFPFWSPPPSRDWRVCIRVVFVVVVAQKGRRRRAVAEKGGKGAWNEKGEGNIGRSEYEQRGGGEGGDGADPSLPRHRGRGRRR